MSWRVGAIMKEPLPVVARFVAWYLEMGATGITIMFDDPDDPAIQALAPIERVTCVPCTEAYWQRLGIPSDFRFTRRQNMALTDLYHSTEEDWLLNVDADEFVYISGGDFNGLLADGASMDVLTIETAELMGPLEPGQNSYFRMPMGRKVRQAVYGEHMELFPLRMGLVGHLNGKSFVRTGIEGVQLLQHEPSRKFGGEKQIRRFTAKDGAYLLHAICTDYDNWRAKLKWRAGSSGFTQSLSDQVEGILAKPDPEPELRELFSILHEARPEFLEQMAKHGSLLVLKLDIDSMVRKHLACDGAEAFGKN